MGRGTCPLPVCPRVSDSLLEASVFSRTKWELVIVVRLLGGGHKFQRMEQWWAKASSMVAAIITIIQSTGVITALFMESYPPREGYIPITSWNAGVISSSFLGEKTNAQNGDVIARAHKVDRGPGWNLNSGLSSFKLMAMNMDSGTSSGSNSSSITYWLCVLEQGA